MHIWNNLQNFLYDKENFLAFFDNKIYIYNFCKITILNKNTIHLQFNDKKLIINGNNLRTIKCSQGELLIEGVINEVKFL